MSGFSILDPSFFQHAPLFIAALFILLFIPSLLVTGAKPEGVARAIACVLWKTFGLVLIALSALQFGANLIEGQFPEQQTLSVLVMILVIGIGFMVHASRLLAGVDAASKAVPRLVFFLTAETIGGLMVATSVITIMTNFLLTETMMGWESQGLSLLLGVVLMLGASMHVNPRRTAGKKKK